MSSSATPYANAVCLSDASSPAFLISPPGGGGAPTSIICGTSGNAGGGGSRTTVGIRTGAIRSYGSGRIRAVAGPTTIETQTLTLRRLAPTEVAQLLAWRDASTLMLLRDTYGQRSFGVVFECDITYIPLDASLSDVAITFSSVTVPAGW